jgi:hypothetical protein
MVNVIALTLRLEAANKLFFIEFNLTNIGKSLHKLPLPQLFRVDYFTPQTIKLDFLPLNFSKLVKYHPQRF